MTSLSTLAVLVIKGGYENYDAFHSMGYWPVGMMETLKALLLTATLFLGPLFETLVVEGYWRECLAGEPVKEVFGDWTVWRNIVAVSVFPQHINLSKNTYIYSDTNPSSRAL